MTVRRVLFVCSGNICRSPMAEAMAKQRFGDRFDISSGGSVARDGDRATDLMQEVAAEHGFDLSGHRARNTSTIRQPDLVFGMEQLHLVEAKRRWPDMEPGSIRLLDHPMGIVDPYGRTIDDYRAAADHIQRAIDALVL